MNMLLSAAKELGNNGYSFISGKQVCLVLEIRIDRSSDIDGDNSNSADFGLEGFTPYFENLQEDPYSLGRRFRAYAQCRRSVGGELEFGHFEAYMQTKEYNPDTGGVVRSYPLVSATLLRNPSFNTLICIDADLVSEYGLVGDPWQLSIGVHLFRYWAKPSRPSYSSPVWLHRDNEDVVFVHLIKKTINVLGGDNIIARDSRTIERVITLQKPGDTLVVDHQNSMR